MSKISLQFSKGVEELGMTLDEIKTYKYCGGNCKQHKNYFKMCFPNDALPEHQDYCVCNHKIKENCYIYKGDEIIVLGNCCIKKFIPSSGRTCEECGGSHRNRKHNICNSCLENRCFECLIPCSAKYKYCNKHGFQNYR